MYLLIEITNLSLSQVVLVVQNLPANAGDIKDAGLIPGSGRSPGGGHGNTLQYSCLENLIDRGAWWAAVHRGVKSWTRPKWLSTHSHSSPLGNYSFVFCASGGWIFDVSVGEVSSANLITSLYIVILQIKYSHRAYEPGLARLIFWRMEHPASVSIGGAAF